MRSVIHLQKRTISTFPHAKQAAELILECRANHPKGPIPGIPPPINPKSANDGYEIAAIVSRKLRHKVGGFKCAATNPVAMVNMKIDEPFFARIFDKDIYKEEKSVTYISPDRFFRVKAEPELTFRMGKDLPSGKAYSETEILDAVESVIPSIEILDSRFYGAVDAYSAIADNASNGALVLSATEQSLPSLEKLSSMRVRLIVDDKNVGEGVSSHVLGNPVNSLFWLVNTLSLKHDISITSGQVIATGCVIPGAVPFLEGDVVRAEFDDFGSVQFFFKNKTREW